MPFLLIFLGIPLVEIAVFMAVGEQIGVGTTLFLALITAIIGGIVIKHQGISTFMAVQNSLQRGNMPLYELFDGFCLVAAGALLITPGFVTDFIGFMLLLPPFRGFFRGFIVKLFKFSVNTDSFGAKQSQNSTVIDVDYEIVEDEPDKDND